MIPRECHCLILHRIEQLKQELIIRIIASQVEALVEVLNDKSDRSEEEIDKGKGLEVEETKELKVEEERKVDDGSKED